MRLILKYIKNYKLKIFLGLTIKIIGTIMDLLLPYILSYIIDDVIPLGKFGQIIWFGFLMLLFAFIGWSFNIIANRIAANVAKHSTKKIRKDLFDKTIRLSLRQCDKITIPSLISRMTTDTYNVHNTIGQIQRLGVRAPILLIGGIIISLTLDPVMTLIMIFALPLIFLVIFIISKFGIPLFTKVQEALDKMVLVVREDINGIKVIKALDKENYEQEHFKSINDKLISEQIRASSYMAQINPLLNLVLNFCLVGVVYLGASRVNLGFTEKGKIIAFLSYFTIVLNAMLSITRVFINISKAQASSKRIEEILNLEDEYSVFESNEYSSHFIEFKNVYFSYNKKTNTLKDISFTLEKGESIGIIGSIGCGKSTIISLLIRLYEPDKGSIYINGKNVKSLESKEIRKNIGIVFQNDIIFGESILNNIKFGRETSIEGINKAIKNAQANDFINEKGLNFELVAKGNNLSGGQKQRILLSRALLNNPSIIILDDSSSALDYKTDMFLRNTIKSNYKDATKIIIASRISSIKACNKILVLDEGSIIDIGSHEDLINRCDLYRRINNTQMGDEHYHEF